MPKLIKKNYPQQIRPPFRVKYSLMLAKAEIPLGEVNISVTTTEELT